MTDYKVRPATDDDLPRLLEFEQGIIAFERPFDETLKPGKINYYDVGQMIQATDVQVLVAESHGQLIASGYAKIVDSKPYCSHDRHAYLGFMYVVPEFRGKGVNQLLVGELINWARDQGLNEVRLEVYRNNPGAIRAYEKVGFKPNMLEMRMGI